MKVDVEVYKRGKASYHAYALGQKVYVTGKTQAEARAKAEVAVASYLERLAAFAPCVRIAKDGTVFVLEINGEGYGYTMVRNQKHYYSNPSCQYSAKNCAEAQAYMLRAFEQYQEVCAA
jgi:hypothetical protein